eukprot:TRINITY_DN11597_c1_g1_i2.p1 TRINITY_DN11597_c1_g1~~TRINITY_DN11597_c1_g1_i2.p1  ORF type:complete len:482 (-),score=70.79 TRINITY_DN11597_c1_g1_i2:118-1563(-)
MSLRSPMSPALEARTRGLSEPLTQKGSHDDIALENMRNIMCRQVSLGEDMSSPLGINPGTTSMLASICLLVQSIMGGGLLAYPHTYQTSGIGSMLILQLFFLIFIAIGLWVLAWCTERTGADTYQGVVKVMLGRRAEIICKMMVVTLIFGAAIVYLDVCVDQVQPLLGLKRVATTIIVALCQATLVLRRDIGSLSIPSLFGFVALIYVCFVIMANFFAGYDAKSHVADDHSDLMWLPTSVSKWFSMIPVICFSYQGHISAVPLYAEMKHRSMNRWSGVISISLLTCVALYNITGILGYMEFLDNTDTDILKSFIRPGYEPSVPQGCVRFASYAVALAVTVTSAVFVFCARSAIMDELKTWLEIELDDERCNRAERSRNQALYFFVTLGWVMSVAFVAICIPNMGVVMSIVGNVSAFFMFQFPGLMLLASAKGAFRKEIPQEGHFTWQPSAWQQWALGLTFLVLGTVVFCLGLANAVYTLIV